MVAADVEEGAQRAVLATYHRDRFVTSGRAGNERWAWVPARRGHDLPRPREHAAALEREEPLVDAPRRRNRRCALERGAGA